MINNNCELKILVKNKSIQEYPFQNNIFIEGRKNSNFEIQFKNNNNFRVLAIISVDGLSVIDGKEADAVNGNGYVVEAYGTLTIPGWKLNGEHAAKFYFAGHDETNTDESYVSLMSGNTNNKGVIGVSVYKEKYVPITYHTTPTTQPYWPYNNPWLTGNTIGSSTVYSSNAADSDSLLRAVCSKSNANKTEVTPQSLGTGFGEATTFATKEVSFQRGDHLTSLVIYYDDIKGLKARGIKIEKSKKFVNSLPQAFPATNTTGCPIPPSYKK